MWRYFTYKNTLRYIDVLEDFVTAYNNRGHTSLNNYAPVAVTKGNQHFFWKLQFKKKKVSKAKFKVGDLVRLSKVPGVFDKSYLRTYTKEVFIVDEIQNTSPKTYIIRDNTGELISGQFYAEELSHVLKDE